MIKNFTLGQYFNTASFIHKLDPRFKLVQIITLIVFVFLAPNFLGLGILSAVVLFVLLLSRVPVLMYLRNLKPIIAIIVLTAILNIFYVKEGTVLFDWNFLTITTEGLIKAAFMATRIILMILISSVLTYTTTPTELTDGLEKCFHLSGNVAMGITIAMRFLSVLSQELDRIMKAQEARGASFHKGGPIKRLKSMSKVLVPLFQNSIDRAANLGEAMDARCYTGGKGRTKLKPLVYDTKDVIGYVLVLVIIVLGVYLAIRF